VSTPLFPQLFHGIVHFKNMAKPEAKLYKTIKNYPSSISWNRIENWAIPGIPDLLGYNKNQKFFTLELKWTKADKVRLSPFQVAFHKKHPEGSFILVSRSLERGTGTTVLQKNNSGGLERGRAHPENFSPVPVPGRRDRGGLECGRAHPIFLYKGSQVLDLVDLGLKLEPIATGLESCIAVLESYK
jgi:hypothetical protein